MKNAILGILLILTSCYSSHSNSQSENTVEAESIIRLISGGKTVILKDKQIIGDLDFTQITSTHPLSPTAERINIQSPVYFENCVFEGDIRAFQNSGTQTRLSTFNSDVIFINCRIKGEVDLSHAHFNGAFTFQEGITDKVFIISNALFDEGTSFSKTRFEKDIHLSNTVFRHRTHFMDIQVLGKTYMQGARFAEDVNWSNAEFSQYVDISKITSYASFMLDYCVFKGPLNISGSTFWGVLNLAESDFKDSAIIRTSLFARMPITDAEGKEVIQFEKNHQLVDEDSLPPSINK